MARITYYKNSFLANVFQFFGYCVLALGVMALLSGDIGEGVLCILGALALMCVGAYISGTKAFTTWWKQITAVTSEQEITKSRDLAVAIYKKNPNNRTLNKIRELNPKAAAYIECGYKEPAAPRSGAGTSASAPVQPVQQQKPVAPVPMQQPAQQNTYQAPVYQQPVNQPPVQQNTYQAPVYQQPVRANMVRGMDGKEYESVDAYIDDVIRLSNNYEQRDPDVYWQCYSKLEWLLEAYPNHERLIINLANMGAYYAWLCDARSFQDYQKAYRAAVRALNYGNQNLSVKEIDTRKSNLMVFAVHGGIAAGNSNTISAMETALEWLRTASGYWFENPTEKMEQYRNVAVPSVRMYVGYWLAYAYMKESPANKQKARAALEEVLQCCPFALIRNCDINPNLKTDTKKLITREEVLELWKATE